ncbi:MAG: MBL fold metallo-hydrolase [bacterium]|nr:MBL fold metallo-hydrolase [bacterium]
MKIEKLTLGQLATNCYLVYDEKSREAVVVDPADEGSFIIQRITDLHLQPKIIIATHGHFDHLLGGTEVKLAFDIPFVIHRADLEILKRTQSTAKHFLGMACDPPPMIDKFIHDNDKISFGAEELKVIETPGHTPGSISLYTPHFLLSGDTLFSSHVGRTDTHYGSKTTILNSIGNKLFKLPPETLVFPGHGQTTTIKAEMKNLKDELRNNLVN